MRAGRVGACAQGHQACATLAQHPVRHQLGRACHYKGHRCPAAPALRCGCGCEWAPRTRGRGQPGPPAAGRARTDLLCQQLQVAARRQRGHRKLVGVLRHDIQRLGADGAGGAQQRELLLRGTGGAGRGLVGSPPERGDLSRPEVARAMRQRPLHAWRDQPPVSHGTLGPSRLGRCSGTGTRPGQAGGGATACTCTAGRAAAALLPRFICWRSGLAATEVATAEICMAAAVRLPLLSSPKRRGKGVLAPCAAECNS